MASDTSHIIQSLRANLLIAVSKGVAAFFTGSGAMLAETIHSAADCANQLLLLLGVNRAAQPPDATHPLGYGRSLYFWSFMVAMLLFTGGGVFSIYEGVHKMTHPEPVENVLIGVGTLGFALVIEGWATYSNIKTLNQRRGAVPFVQYLRQTKDSDLIVVFGENAAATLGLALALIALGLAEVTGDPHWDGAGSLAVGLVLVGVAVFLAVEVKSLLVGESADPLIEADIRALLKEESGVIGVGSVLTVQQGPGEVLVAMKLRFSAELSAAAVAATINALETRIRARQPSVRWCFVEPGEGDED
ncbi:MAG: cation diffusion facilitator family transporter [Deltaproteobacteria bacterium]|jgi:cation diffusion facilitator family transporter|nr:cation diffusion facilitator family transporter [Deltaproteobacteria bacterium]